VSWSAYLQHTDTGLAIVFAGPVSRLDMAPDVAQHLASLLAVEARHRLAGVVRTLRAELPSTSAVRMREPHALCCDCDNCLNGDHHHGK
jgi:hypothetical protein